MKSLLLTLFVMVGGLSIISSAYADERSIFTVTDNEPQAVHLVTKPVTINNQWRRNSNRNRRRNLQQAAKSVSLIREQGCRQVKPLELLEDPSLFFKECEQEQNHNQIPEYTQQIDYFKPPRLDPGTGISVTVTQF